MRKGGGGQGQLFGELPRAAARSPWGIRLTALFAGVALSVISQDQAAAQEKLPRAIAWVTADTSPFAGAGLKFAFGRSVDTPGPMLMVTAGTDGAAVLAGYQMNVLDAHVFAAAGPEYRAEGGLGLRGHLELWARPFPRLSASVVVACGTADTECWSRSRLGFLLGRGVHLGPEGILASDRTGVGFAITGMQLGPVQLEISGGAERPWRGRIRPYGAAAMIGRF